MAEDHDSWLGGIGVDVGGVLSSAVQQVEDTASSVVQKVEDTASGVVEKVEDTASGVVQAVGDSASSAVQAAENTVSNIAQSVSELPSSAVQAAVPAPDPTTLEVIEEAAVSGVREIVKVAPVVLEGAAIATIAPVVAVGVGAAILLWSSDVGAVWDGKTNPETGKPYTSQEEYDRVQASLRDKRKNAQPLPPPVPGKDYDDDKPPPAPTCKSLGIPICGKGGGGGFENLADAESQEPDRGKIARVNVDSMGAYAQYPEGRNNHRTYYDENGDKLFTLVYSPCCTDTPIGPKLTWRWRSAD